MCNETLWTQNIVAKTFRNSIFSLLKLCYGHTIIVVLWCFLCAPIHHFISIQVKEKKWTSKHFQTLPLPPPHDRINSLNGQSRTRKHFKSLWLLSFCRNVQILGSHIIIGVWLHIFVRLFVHLQLKDGFNLCLFWCNVHVYIQITIDMKTYNIFNTFSNCFSCFKPHISAFALPYIHAIYYTLLFGVVYHQ